MQENTHHLNLPYIMPAQAQKHVTHNEALRVLDRIVQISVLAAEVEEPPPTPEAGERYILGSNPTAQWQGKAGYLASFVDGAWFYSKPERGWLAWDRSKSELLVYVEEGWRTLVRKTNAQTESLGINGEASQSERFVVQSDSVLFNHDGTDHRMKLNKKSVPDIASIILQTNFSGRAELGLSGDDDFTLRVSEDGVQWQDAVRINHKSGHVLFPADALEISSDLISNLLPDSGRFHSSSQQQALLSNTASQPGYLSAFNGASLTYPFKFINNNGTFGQSSNPLDPTMAELITKIYGPAGSRFGPEFWCMKIEAGPGQSSMRTINGDDFYRATIVSPNPRPRRFTTGFFCKADTGKISLIAPNGTLKRLLRDGNSVAPGTSGVVVLPEDGWVYFEMQIMRSNISFEQNDMSLMMLPDSVGFFALPRVTPGWLGIGGDVAIVTNDRVFGG
ncbi:MAG: DUF2793 domain-containing protein [Pseudomonadota bacterium]